MAAHPTKSGREPSPNVGPKHYPSSTFQPSPSLQSYHRSTSIRNSSSIPTSPSPSQLSEEQLAKLPPVFREKTHQQCLEMEANYFKPDYYGARDQFFHLAFEKGMIRLVEATKQLFFTLAYVFGFVMIAGIGLGLVLSVLSILFGLVFVLPYYAIKNHRALVSLRKSNHGLISLGRRPGPYYAMFVMGSGGHTTEMISMMEYSIRPAPGMYRRYIVNDDDVMSRERVITLEQQVGRRFAAMNAPLGLFDIAEIKRGRKVHQGWISTLFSAAGSLMTISEIIFHVNPYLYRHLRPDWRFPGVVITNGPGTGFLVLLAIHIFKMFKFIPADKMNTVYIESFAKVSTLSLTGKLIYYTNIADLFIVQHPALCENYDVYYADNFVARSAEPAVPGNEEGEGEE